MISVLIIAAVVNAQARTGIERLHQQDVAATLSGKADDLAKLWDNDAVRIQPGRPVEIGKAVIYANDKRWEAGGGHGAACYVAEIQNVQIAGDAAFEDAGDSGEGVACYEAAAGRHVEIRQRDGDPGKG